MKLQIELDAKTSATLRKVRDADTDNFVELAELAGLDPKTDFRYGNWDGCDFTDCDLRGFDFTGSSMRGVTMDRTITDETTIFIDVRWD